MTSIAFIHPFIFRYPRGIERYTVNLSSTLVQHGVNVDILTWRWTEPISWPELDPQVRVKAIPTAKYYAAYFAPIFLVHHLLRHRYDMIYLHFADYGEAITMRTLRRLGRHQPYSIVLHFPYPQVPHRYETMKTSGLLANAQQIIAVSNYVAEEAEAFSGRPSKVISHGVDTDMFCPCPEKRDVVRAMLDIPARAPLLLTVAALEERKGVQWVLKALPHILKHQDDVYYVIVGDGPHRSRLENLAHEMGIIRRVKFLGEQTEVAPFYQAADLMLILARGEASSIASLEAMACGVPVLASRHPPFDELVKRGWGQQMDETNIGVLAQQIIELLTDPQKRSKLGRNGRMQILQHHTWGAIAEQYLANHDLCR